MYSKPIKMVIMGKLTSMLPQGMRKRIEDGIIAYHLRKCDRLECKAGSYDYFDFHLAAGITYHRAANQAHKLGDRDREIRLLLRSTDSLEDHADELQRMAGISRAGRTQAKFLYMIDALTYAANNVRRMVRLGQSEFAPREQRLRKRARGILDSMP